MKTQSHVCRAAFVAFAMASLALFASDASAGKSDQFIAKCLGCHGQKGVSGHSDFPNLAGLSQDYLLKQLHAFRSGERSDPTLGAMPFMVEHLSDDDLFGLAEIFARLPAESVGKKEMTERDVELFDAGKKLIESNGVTCRYCHLSNETGDGPLDPTQFPDLVGQQKNYLVKQIKEFRDKKRWTPIMNSDLLGPLTDDDIDAVATYLRFMKVRKKKK